MAINPDNFVFEKVLADVNFMSPNRNVSDNKSIQVCVHVCVCIVCVYVYVVCTCICMYVCMVTLSLVYLPPLCFL